jgi:hypothetical protein
VASEKGEFVDAFELLPLYIRIPDVSGIGGR